MHDLTHTCVRVSDKAAEGMESARMDESIIKQITGEYAITVRKLYENESRVHSHGKDLADHEPRAGDPGDG
jgi:hypothetical protein